MKLATQTPLKRLVQSTVLVLLFAAHLPVFAQKLALYDLKVEYQDNPLNIETPQPRFSWKLRTEIKSTMQAFYEIRVGTDLKNIGSSWKTAKTSDQSVHVLYEGAALQPRTRYYWQVRVKDNHGNTSAWSEPKFWQMGLNSAEWTAKWISADQDTSRKSPLFRKQFNLGKTLKHAVAYITAKGLYEAQINGKKVGDSYFTPGWTSYAKRLQYQTYDVTGLFKKGDNAIGVALGDGWYRGYIGFGNQRNFYGSTRALLLQIELTYTDGTKQTIQTDDSWKTSYGPILSSDIYNGEYYDSRLEKNGWNSTGYVEDTSWKPVKVLNDGKNELVGMVGPTVKKHEEFKVLKLIRTPKGETVVDFGQNLVGWVKLKIKGAEGTNITLSHAEVLDKAGNFYTENLRRAKQQNTYILNGSEQTFEPHFSFQGFRYVKIEGYPGQIDTAGLTAVAVYSNMQQTGSFVTSNKLLNQLQHNIQWGQKGNFVDVPTDCPQRDERLGWTGDAQAFYRTAAYNMDVAGFFTKWLKDLKADQQPNGSVPHVIPNVLGAGDGGSAGWADVSTIIPWDMYVAYGDKRILEEQYESMKSWVNFIQGKSKNNLWNTTWHFGDWLFYTPDDDVDGRSAVTDKHLIAQTFYAHSTQLLLNAATVLGKQDDIAKYTKLLADVKAAFVSEYLTPNGRMVSGTQTAYVLALQFDMLPEALRAQAAERLAKNVKDYGNHLTTGFLGTPYLCHVLSRFGYTDVAYDLLMQESYPSWLYPVKMGATTIWERWDGIKPDGSFQNAGMNSYNHYAYGAIGDWMYRTMAGINSEEAAPGYKKITIKPQPGGKIESVSAELMTSYGLVKSAWKIEGDLFKLDVVIPPNTTASVILPGKQAQELGSGTYHLETKR